MRARLLPVTIIVALAAGGCGGATRPTTRAKVASYIQRVNGVEAALTPQLAAVTRAGSGLALAHTARQIAPIRASLVRANVQIRALQLQLDAIATPAPARRLHALVVELVSDQAAMTRQLLLLANYLPRFATVLRPLGPATLRLEAALAPTQASGTAAVAALTAAKADALDRFRRDLMAVGAQLRRLHPPMVSQPGYRAQVRTLQRMSSSAAALAGALRTSGQADLLALFHRFDVAAAGNQTAAVQRAQRAAVLAYDHQAHRLDALVTQIERERANLNRSLH